MYSKAMFADNLKKVITQRGTTQREIAEKLGVTETTISRYTTPGPKGRTPNVEALVALAQALNVSLDTLVGVEGLPAAAAKTPDVAVLVSCYEKASSADRQVLWALLDRYMTPEQRALVTSVQNEESVKIG